MLNIHLDQDKTLWLPMMTTLLEGIEIMTTPLDTFGGVEKEIQDPDNSHWPDFFFNLFYILRILKDLVKEKVKILITLPDIKKKIQHAAGWNPDNYPC